MQTAKADVTKYVKIGNGTHLATVAGRPPASAIRHRIAKKEVIALITLAFRGVILMLDAQIMVNIVTLRQKNVRRPARKIRVQTQNIRRVIHGEPVMLVNVHLLRAKAEPIVFRIITI